MILKLSLKPLWHPKRQVIVIDVRTDVEHDFLQDECRAAEAPVPSAKGEGAGEGAGGAAGAAEPAARSASEAAVERRLGPGPALWGCWHQDRDPELGWGAAAAPSAQQVCDFLMHSVCSLLNAN